MFLLYYSNLLHHIGVVYRYFTRDGRQFTSLCDYVHKVANDVIAERKEALVKCP